MSVPRQEPRQCLLQLDHTGSWALPRRDTLKHRLKPSLHGVTTSTQHLPWPAVPPVPRHPSRWAFTGLCELAASLCCLLPASQPTGTRAQAKAPAGILPEPSAPVPSIYHPARPLSAPGPGIGLPVGDLLSHWGALPRATPADPQLLRRTVAVPAPSSSPFPMQNVHADDRHRLVGAAIPGEPPQAGTDSATSTSPWL